ncbi:MAG: septum formation initiator family protein [Aggregatilineaceae bacterium]
MSDDPLTFAPGDEPPPVPRRRERPQQISNVQIVFALLLSIGLLLVINFSGRIARGQQMEAERQRLQATIDVLEREKLELLRARDYAASDAAVEEWAHREAKMVRDGEVLVIPIPGNLAVPTAAPPPPVYLPTPVPEPAIPNWHLWWNLFFDGEPPF